MQVAVLHDRVSADAHADEMDTLVQVQSVSDGLRRLGHVPRAQPFDLDLATCRQALQRSSPDIVFNLVESVEGRGALIHLAPHLLDHMGLAYTGAPAEAVYLTSNKVLTKEILRVHHLPTPPWCLPDESDHVSLGFDGPYIVKSVWEHASVDLDADAVVHGAAGLREILARRRAMRSGRCFVEAFVAGREFNIGLLAGRNGLQVLPPAEIRFVGFGPDEPKIVGYRAKWDSESRESRNTPRHFDFEPGDAELLDRLAKLAETCWRIFHLRGYARVDFRVDDRGTPQILEINANPCLSPDAGFLAAAAKAGLTATDVIKRIVDDIPHRLRTRVSNS